MMKSLILTWLMLTLFCAMGGHAATPNTKVLVCAAASLRPGLQALQKQYPFDIHTAASSTLERQIRAGASCDVFISAHLGILNDLYKHKLIEQINPFLTNNLVRIRSTTSQNKNIKTLAIPNKKVPLGIYARKLLASLNQWPWKGDVILTEHARSTVAAVASGSADIAIIYQSDANPSDSSYTMEPLSNQPEVKYGLSIVAKSRYKQQAKAFTRFVTGDKSLKVWKHNGFSGI